MELGHDKVVEVISEHRSRLHCTYKFCSPPPPINDFIIGGF